MTELQPKMRQSSSDGVMREAGFYYGCGRPATAGQLACPLTVEHLQARPKAERQKRSPGRLGLVEALNHGFYRPCRLNGSHRPHTDRHRRGLMRSNHAVVSIENNRSEP
jgi:hypothetical protein